MSYGSPEEATILQKPDAIAEKGKAEEILYSGFEDWLKNDFKGRYRKLLRKEVTVYRDIELTELMRDFSIGMFNLGRNRKLASKWSVKLYQTLFGDQPESVMSAFNQQEKPVAVRNMIGPISVCTFLDLVSRSRPELFAEISKDGLTQEVAEGKTDVKDKVDLTLRFGDKNSRGQEIIRLIQLKATSMSDVDVVKILYPDRGYFRGLISEGDSTKILAKADRIASEQNAEVRAYGVLVPSYDSDAVGNVFGIIVPNSENAKALPGLFSEIAEKQGLLPAAKST